MKEVCCHAGISRAAGISACPAQAPLSAQDCGEPALPSVPTHSIRDEAAGFLDLFRREKEMDDSRYRERLRSIDDEIAETGSYTHTFDELSFGARVAWRNNSHCIGRLFWRGLDVLDRRDCRTPAEIFKGCTEHIDLATNGGNIRSLITVFAPHVPGHRKRRIWNSQLIRYAGYRRGDGSILGDPLQAGLTDAALRLGWRPPTPRTRFDVLPLIIQGDDGALELHSLRQDSVLEVRLRHPDFDWFEDLGLKWHALPAISDMNLIIGGVEYPTAPFNGWYVSHEIGARNLSDQSRYDLLPLIADRMGLDRSHEKYLWKDRALLELNRSVIYSFTASKVKVVDHHSASKQFMIHIGHESALGREVPADWSWIVPPISGSTSPAFHREFTNPALMPNFLYQEPVDRLEAIVSRADTDLHL